jgi:hypothetical protein
VQAAILRDARKSALLRMRSARGNSESIGPIESIHEIMILLGSIKHAVVTGPRTGPGKSGEIDICHDCANLLE